MKINDSKNNDYTELMKYKTLFLKAREIYRRISKYNQQLIEENEELKDTIKRFTCQSECYKHKEAEKYKQTLKNIKSIIKPIEDGLSYHHWEEQVYERCQQVLDIIDKNLKV